VHCYTLRIWVLFPKQIATQSGCVVDHCSWLISAPALYARIGSARGQAHRQDQVLRTNHRGSNGGGMLANVSGRPFSQVELHG